jgi:hypothetical protein
VGRAYCSTCEALKEFYWLKLNRFLLAARSASAWGAHRYRTDEDALQVSKEESLAALRTLIRHATACYGLAEDEAA